MPERSSIGYLFLLVIDKVKVERLPCTLTDAIIPALIGAYHERIAQLIQFAIIRQLQCWCNMIMLVGKSSGMCHLMFYVTV